MFIFRHFDYSRTIVLGTALLSTVLEILSGTFFLAYKFAVVQVDDPHAKTKDLSEHELVTRLNGNGVHTDEKVVLNQSVANAISNECGSEMMQEVVKIAGRNLTDRTAVLSTPTAFNITSLGNDQYHYIINLYRINSIKKPNDLMDAVNRKLELNGFFFCCVETKEQRKKRLLKKFPPVLNYIYYTFDFIIKRILPKIVFTQKLYYFLTHGENNVFSRAEVLGRLCRAGFIISQESFIGNLLCIEAKKIGNPLPINDNNYGLLIALPRVGKYGQMIKVYKLRTMHPYSEYIQDYVYNLNHLQEGGKFKYDFRITSWGAICRKIWLDELPMFINLIRGEMKLVGVRPLSRQYFELYKKNVRDRRIKYKPGLIPPYYVHLPDNLNGIQASEMKYLDSFDKHPALTDFSYFWKSWWNILFRHARSK
jgi:hypothetical protein